MIFARCNKSRRRGSTCICGPSMMRNCTLSVPARKSVEKFPLLAQWRLVFCANNVHLRTLALRPMKRHYCAISHTTLVHQWVSVPRGVRFCHVLRVIRFCHVLRVIYEYVPTVYEYVPTVYEYWAHVGTLCPPKMIRFCN